MASIEAKYYYLTLGLLLFCTLVGLMVAFRFQREVDHDLAPTTEKDLLGPLEKAFYSGLMDEAKFLRIRESIERQKAGEAPLPKRSTAVTTPPKPIEPGPDPDSETEPEEG